MIFDNLIESFSYWDSCVQDLGKLLRAPSPRSSTRKTKIYKERHKIRVSQSSLLVCCLLALNSVLNIAYKIEASINIKLSSLG